MLPVVGTANKATSSYKKKRDEEEALFEHIQNNRGFFKTSRIMLNQVESR